MRILQIVPQAAGGGGEWLAVSLHHWMVARGIDARIVSLLGQTDENLNLPRPRATGRAIYEKGWYELWRLCQRLDRNHWKPDVVQAHMYPAQVLAATVARRFWPAAALSTTEHSTWNRRRRLPFGRSLDFQLFSQFRSIVCISLATMDSLAGWQPSLVDRMRVIRNGIDLPSHAHAAGTRKREYTVIVSVGRLEAVKNYRTALEAIALLKDLPVEYWIVGSGSQHQELCALSRTLGIENRVRFLGWRDDVVGILQEADIFLMPSLWEGFGLALVQGMATGLPVVTSDIPASREILGGSQAGYQAPATDARAFAQGLRRLVTDTGLRRRMGARARLRACDFDFNNMATGYMRLFTELLETAR